jgi:integrase
MPNYTNPFVAHLAGKGLADRSINEYDKMIRRAERWLADRRLRLLTAAPHHIRTWSDTLPNSWSTRKQARTALGHWQTWAGHPEDLAGAVRVPRKPKPRPRALPDDDAARLEAAAHLAGHRGVATLLGLYLGMRRVEIAAASWTSLHGDEWVWQRAKTGDMAALPIHPRLRVALEVYERARLGPFLFPGDKGRPHVAASTVWKWVRDVGTSCGVDVATHQLRHTCISQIVDTVGIRVGQQWAGHRDPEVTAGYSRVPQQRMVEAMGSLDIYQGVEPLRSIDDEAA